MFYITTWVNTFYYYYLWPNDFINLSVGEQVSCFHFEVILNNSAVLLWGGCTLRVEELGQMVLLCLTYWGTVNLFSEVTISFPFPPSVYENSDLSTNVPNLVISPLDYSHLVDEKQYLIMVLID